MTLRGVNTQRLDAFSLLFMLQKEAHQTPCSSHGLLPPLFSPKRNEFQGKHPAHNPHSTNPSYKHPSCICKLPHLKQDFRHCCTQCGGTFMAQATCWIMRGSKLSGVGTAQLLRAQNFFVYSFLKPKQFCLYNIELVTKPPAISTSETNSDHLQRTLQVVTLQSKRVS